MSYKEIESVHRYAPLLVPICFFSRHMADLIIAVVKSGKVEKMKVAVTMLEKEAAIAQSNTDLAEDRRCVLALEMKAKAAVLQALIGTNGRNIDWWRAISAHQELKTAIEKLAENCDGNNDARRGFEICAAKTAQLEMLCEQCHQKITIHILSGANPLCEFTNVPWHEWPENDLYVDEHNATSANCVQCIKRKNEKEGH